MILDELLADYLADTLPRAARAAVEEQLLDDPATLRRFVVQRRMDAELRALLDQQAQQIGAGIMAGGRCLTDEAVVERVLADTIRSPRKNKFCWQWPVWQAAWGWTAAMALLLGIIAIASWWLLAESRRGPSIAQVLSIADARWLAVGPFGLTAGVVELKLANGMLMAVEGPARLTLIGQKLIELQAGRLSAEVSKMATGFTVKTRSATLVDLGTRFGPKTRRPAAIRFRDILRTVRCWNSPRRCYRRTPWLTDEFMPVN